MILRKLEQEIVKYTQGFSLLVHDHALTRDHTVEFQEMWEATKQVMQTMVVNRVVKSATEEIQCMNRLLKEFDL